jgi:hypothetical protein
MMKLPVLALVGTAAAALAGTALAASSDHHAVDVALPDGSVAHIEYRGDVAPKVTIQPMAPAGVAQGWAPIAFPVFPEMDAMFEQMRRQIIEAQRMARQPVAVPGMNVAAFGNMPAGANSVSVVSVSNGGKTCTRTTEVTSAGAGKPPKVVTNVSGDCGAAPAVPHSSAEPLDHT